MADIEKEIQAIKTVLGALEPLPADVRANVLEYVLKRLSIQVQGPARVEAPPPSTFPTIASGAHIEDLKNSKKPRSANEMAALVAYYLAEVAPAAEQKQSITTEDIRRYFKIARFPLPRRPSYTLPNAKAAGYFDLAGSGGYRLNPVGYNLVVHAMPRGDGVSKKERKPAKHR